MRNFRELLKTEAQIKGFINLPQTAYNEHIFKTAYDALTCRNGIRILVVNDPIARSTYEFIFSKLGYEFSGDKFIIGNSVILFSDVYNVPRGMYYKYIIRGE